MKVRAESSERRPITVTSSHKDNATHRGCVEGSPAQHELCRRSLTSVAEKAEVQRRHSTALTCTQLYKRGLKTCDCVHKASSHKESRRWTVLANIIGVGSKLRVCGSAVVAAGSSHNEINASIPTHTLGLHVCTSVQQHPHNVSIPPLSRKVQRTASLLGLIGRATNLHQRTTTQ
jgi:hypothetical protein